MTGRIQGHFAEVRFSSSFGAHGVAQVSVSRGKLHWKILSKDDGVTYMPDDADLTRRSKGGGIVMGCEKYMGATPAGK